LPVPVWSMALYGSRMGRALLESNIRLDHGKVMSKGLMGRGREGMRLFDNPREVEGLKI
jgi:hypothetical protein